MRTKLPNILIALLFVVGAGIFLYPTADNFFYERSASQAVVTYGETVQEASAEDVQAQREAARAYNEGLYRNPVILTEPFDEDAWDHPSLNGYNELLNLTEEMAFIEIPRLGQTLPVYHGTGEDALQKGVGHLQNTSLPIGGESTHAVLCAHCGLPQAELFTHLDTMEVGDIFRITVLGETLTYKVYDIQVVEPAEVSSLYVEEGRDLVTLLTCTPYGSNTHRLLVHGERTSDDASTPTANDAPEEPTGIPWGAIALGIVALMAFIFVIALARGRKGSGEPDNRTG